MIPTYIIRNLQMKYLNFKCIFKSYIGMWFQRNFKQTENITIEKILLVEDT